MHGQDVFRPRRASLRSRSRSGGSSMRDDVEAIEEVLAKAPGATSASRSRLVAAMMRTSTSMVVGAADALEAALLEEPQQLRLQRRAELADLVEEQRAAGCRLEPAGLVRPGAGEGALDVAEELALEEMLRQRGARDGDEGPCGARAPAVDGARQHALARAALAGEQYRRVRTPPPDARSR